MNIFYNYFHERHWIRECVPFVILLSVDFESLSRHRNRGNASVRVQFGVLIRRAKRVYVVSKSRVNFRHLRTDGVERARGNIGIYRTVQVRRDRERATAPASRRPGNEGV